jgi:hypothetical protein
MCGHEVINLIEPYLWRVDSNVNTGTISLLTLNPFNVYNKLFPVHLYNFPNLLTLVMTSYNLGKRERNPCKFLMHTRFPTASRKNPRDQCHTFTSTQAEQWGQHITLENPDNGHHTLSHTCLICEWFSSSFHFQIQTSKFYVVYMNATSTTIN